MFALVSQAGTPNLEEDYIFPEESMGYFGSGRCGDFVDESVVSGSLEELDRKELSYGFLGTQYGKFQG